MLCARSTWHLLDHVAVLRRLRWGEVPYANLRYRNGPNNNLKCALSSLSCMISMQTPSSLSQPSACKAACRDPQTYAHTCSRMEATFPDKPHVTTCAVLWRLPAQNIHIAVTAVLRCPRRWKCRDQTDDERYQKFDCGWVGNRLRPGSLRPRKERLVTPLTRDEWVDSVELREVRSSCTTALQRPAPMTRSSFQASRLSYRALELA